MRGRFRPPAAFRAGGGHVAPSDASRRLRRARPGHLGATVQCTRRRVVATHLPLGYVPLRAQGRRPEHHSPCSRRTRDGHLDVLVHQDGDGSDGCGDYDLLVTAAGAVHEVFHVHECLDNTAVALRPNALVIDRGVAYAPHGNHVHPVFKSFRRTVKRWNGRQLVTANRSIIRPSQMLSGPYAPTNTSCRAPRRLARVRWVQMSRLRIPYGTPAPCRSAFLSRTHRRPRFP
ncbi:MAG: hypothetical protein QOJ35_1916 [Solirubrobacteraceae bacterium]|nr:hypothetical protein [Solirubrobacteraceae bacterium]